MALLCIKCDKDILNKEFLIRLLCENYYHLDCTSVSSQRFYLMTKANKKSYRCHPCLYDLNQQNKEINTPLLHAQGSKENITMRNKCKVNIPTNNSFETLSEDSESEIYDEYSSTPGTPNTLTNTLNRSLPELQTNATDKINELKGKICKLAGKLEIAENEIENLISENGSLTKRITEYKLRIDQLTHICKSTSKNTSIKKKQKSFNRIQLDFSPGLNNSTEWLTPETTVEPSTSEDQNIQQPESPSTSETDNRIQPSEINNSITGISTTEETNTQQIRDLPRNTPQINSTYTGSTEPKYQPNICLISSSTNNVLRMAEQTFEDAHLCH